MALRPQNSAKGNFAKQKIVIPVGYGVQFEDYSATADAITASASGLKFAAGIALSGQTKYLTANSTATLIIPTVTAIPTARVVGGLAFVSNSTGKMLAYHSTGTTWAYLNKTSVLA